MFNRNVLAPLPSWFNRWFGYRSAPVTKPPDYIIWFWSFIGAFCGISVIQAVFEQAHYFVRRKVPTIVASYVSLAATTLFSFLNCLVISSDPGCLCSPSLWSD